MAVKIPNSYTQLINQEEYCADNLQYGSSKVCLVSSANLPTKFGDFIILAFHFSGDDKEHTVIVKGDVLGKENVLVRIHSECLTGDAMGSLRCDCRDQLQGGLRKIEEENQGMLLYMKQEGRGIGLTNKIRAYELQDHGMDTYEANIALGYPEDLRDYTIAAQILKYLNIKSIRLLTNNPHKITELQKLGIEITERIDHSYPANDHNKKYLMAKKEHGFFIDVDSL